MKICKSTKVMQGCGLPFDESNFYPTKKWLNSVCISCFNRYKRKKHQEKKAIKKIERMVWR